MATHPAFKLPHIIIPREPTMNEQPPEIIEEYNQWLREKFLEEHSSRWAPIVVKKDREFFLWALKTTNGSECYVLQPTDCEKVTFRVNQIKNDEEDLYWAEAPLLMILINDVEWITISGGTYINGTIQVLPETKWTLDSSKLRNIHEILDYLGVVLKED